MKRKTRIEKMRGEGVFRGEEDDYIVGPANQIGLYGPGGEKIYAGTCRPPSCDSSVHNLHKACITWLCIVMYSSVQFCSALFSSSATSMHLRTAHHAVRKTNDALFYYSIGSMQNVPSFWPIPSCLKSLCCGFEDTWQVRLLEICTCLHHFSQPSGSQEDHRHAMPIESSTDVLPWLSWNFTDMGVGIV